jgi:hypothetical protein
MCEFRKKTEELFSITAKPEVWSPARQMVKNAFVAYPSRAFPAKSVFQISVAIEALMDSPENLGYIEDALKFFVRRKVLRSRMGDGKVRLYEVNY